MSFRQDMIQTARRGVEQLGERGGLVGRFLLRQQNADGGFRNRSGQSDLLDTAYALLGWAALLRASSAERARTNVSSLSVEDALARAESFLRTAGEGQSLNLGHLSALVRAWAALGELRRRSAETTPDPGALQSLLESYRAREGGYHAERGSQFGSAQGCFLAVGALQDLGATIPDAEGLIRCLNRLQVEPGVYTNFLAPDAVCNLRSRIGSTIATAATVAVFQHFGHPTHPATASWLLGQCRAEGGFLALPKAPLPDLGSTANALQTLERLGVALDGVQAERRAYVESLWSDQGGFHGHSYDVKVDAETTFAGLLAMGCL